MGYSNNKWRKILYILMIINLCFILFAKFNKVFAYYNGYGISNTFQVTYNNNTYDITVPDSDLFNFDEVNAIYGVRNGDNLIFYVLVDYPDSTLKVRVDGSTNYIRNYVSATSDTEITSGDADPYVFRFWYYLPTGQIWNISENLSKTIADNYSSSIYNFVYATKNVLKRSYSPSENNTIYFSKNSVEIKYPQIANTMEQLETLDFDVLSINAWDYSNEDFDVLLYDLNYGSDTTASLYPVNVITLNKETLYYNSTLTADPDKNAIYWIPIEELGFNWVKGNKYGIKFAIRDYGIQGGGGFRGDDFIYQYIGEETVFTVSNTVPDSTITALNNSTQNNIQNNQHEEIVNNMNNITNNLDNVNDALTNTTPDSSVSSDIDSSLNFNNQNEGLNNLNNGFFSRLTSMLSNLLGYNLADDTSVSIPLPNSNKTIVLHSKIIYDNVTGALRLIINAFWVYIFSFYMWKFINKIYIAISTGNILDTFSSSGEAITNDML